ncbi:hypothetical protein [Streptomyces sp. NRRL B-24484]|uniref:hypothetical protein n=1 Tax=Streptomyces sp. NRRL B-24484 TaxID=1463833 RepID=UPI0004BF90DA|nr:hypothetical protein [Streptomyces sp. NRRL B-24484]
MPRSQHRRQSVLRARRLAAPPLRPFLPAALAVCLPGPVLLRGTATDAVFHDGRTGVLAAQGLLALVAVLALRLGREAPGHPITPPVQRTVHRRPLYFVPPQSSITAVTGGRPRRHNLRRTGEVSAPIVEV